MNLEYCNCLVLHKSIIHRDNEDLASTRELVAKHVTGDMGVRAGGRERGGDTNDETFSRSEFFG